MINGIRNHSAALHILGLVSQRLRDENSDYKIPGPPGRGLSKRLTTYSQEKNLCNETSKFASDKNGTEYTVSTHEKIEGQ